MADVENSRWAPRATVAMTDLEALTYAERMCTAMQAETPNREMFIGDTPEETVALITFAGYAANWFCNGAMAPAEVIVDERPDTPRGRTLTACRLWSESSEEWVDEFESELFTQMTGRARQLARMAAEAEDHPSYRQLSDALDGMEIRIVSLSSTSPSFERFSRLHQVAENVCSMLRRGR